GRNPWPCEHWGRRRACRAGGRLRGRAGECPLQRVSGAAPQRSAPGAGGALQAPLDRQTHTRPRAGAFRARDPGRMTVSNQQSIRGEAELEGIGLHTGEPTRIRFRPAPANTGIRFRRVDLEGEPEIRATLENVVSAERGTTLAVGEARVHTVEHVLAAAAALGLDNLFIDVHGPEIPILDGSFLPFYEALSAAGPVAQDAPAAVLEIGRTISLSDVGGASYVVLPARSYRISATIEFDHALVRRQFASFDLGADGFREEIAPARTFGFMAEAEQLRARGLALGATLENAVILDEEGVASGELRFRDEFVRHKSGAVGEMGRAPCRERVR